MARMRDLTGMRFGHLTVLDLVEMTTYGGRRQGLWHCRCDCGEELDLPTDKLPVTERQRESMMKSGRRLYDRCEKCRAKTCPVCGRAFSYSHPSFICDRPECQAALRRERIRFWSAISALLYRTDPEYRAQYRAYQNAYYAQHPRRLPPISELPPAEQERVRAAAREAYQRMRADPERWKHWLELRRAYRQRQKLRGLAAPETVENIILEEDDAD